MKFTWTEKPTGNHDFTSTPQNIEGQSPSKWSLQPIPENVHQMMECDDPTHGMMCSWVATKWNIPCALKRLKHIRTPLTNNTGHPSHGKSAHFGRAYRGVFSWWFCAPRRLYDRWKDSHLMRRTENDATHLKVSIRATSNFGPWPATTPPLGTSPNASLWEANPSCPSADPSDLLRDFTNLIDVIRYSNGMNFPYQPSSAGL